LCAASAACNYPKESEISLADADYRAKFPIRVESNLVQANFVGTGAGQLTLDELVQLDQVVSDYIAHGQKPLVIVMPDNALEYRNLASEIERRVMLRHLARSEVLLGVDPEAAMNDEVTVSYLMHTAIAPECGYWHDDQGFNDDNDNSDNFGCATQRNMALMVANPGDLVQPQPFSTRDAERTAAIIQAYRAGENPQATWPVDSSKAQVDFGSTNP
jgi:pilus assembly protein CpaD